MLLLRLTAFLLVAAAVFGQPKRDGPRQSGNDVMDIFATAYVDRDAVVKLLGADPGFHLVVLDVKVSPKDDKEIALWRDDFTLLSNKDGQRSQPLAPTQIAGRGGLVITQTGGSGGVGMANPQQRGPIWGGGVGSTDRPRRIGGDEQATGAATPREAKATANTSQTQQEAALLKILKERVLPEKEITEPATGLLYFLFEGKHKVKDLDLIYKGQHGRLIIDFEK